LLSFDSNKEFNEKINEVTDANLSLNKFADKACDETKINMVNFYLSKTEIAKRNKNNWRHKQKMGNPVDKEFNSDAKTKADGSKNNSSSLNTLSDGRDNLTIETNQAKDPKKSNQLKSKKVSMPLDKQKQNKK
jgi:hypothetical protein